MSDVAKFYNIIMLCIHPLTILGLLFYWMFHFFDNLIQVDRLKISIQDEFEKIDSTILKTISNPIDDSSSDKTHYTYNDLPVRYSVDGYAYIAINSRVIFLTNSNTLNKITFNLQIGVPRYLLSIPFNYVTDLYNEVHVNTQNCLSLPPIETCTIDTHLLPELFTSKFDDDDYSNSLYYDGKIIRCDRMGCLYVMVNDIVDPLILGF